jgi:hypothetical protein
MTGTQYRRLIARYVLANFGSRGIQIYEEVPAGTSIIGKQRRLDLLIVHQERNSAVAIECKYQESAGTVDEKIPYALDDLAALPMPGVIVYAGSGFSEGVLHLLQGSARAAYCLPQTNLRPQPRRQGDGIDCGTWQLDHFLAMTLAWWDLLTCNKSALNAQRSLLDEGT